MIPLTRAQLATLRHWLLPERPGPLVAQHVANTGKGACRADRWPGPRALVAETGGNYTLAGDPSALRPDDLRGLITGFVEAPPPFVPLLRSAFDDVHDWQRVILTLDGEPAEPPAAAHAVRRLDPGDEGQLAALSAESGWISNSWGGPAGLAGSGTAWGAFVSGCLVAVACPFFVGSAYEDLGVATEPQARGQGLSTACAAAVCRDVRARGRTPSWTTSPDNAASLRVAEKLGFAPRRRDVLRVVGIPIPEPARRPAR